MKKWVIFVLGIITGVILTISILMAIGLHQIEQTNLPGLTLFEEPGKYVSENSFEIFQVLDSGDALAIERKKSRYGGIESGVTVLFLNKGKGAYYDEQIIKAPTGYCVRQVGVYKYMTSRNFEKTVPAVWIFEK